MDTLDRKAVAALDAAAARRRVADLDVLRAVAEANAAHITQRVICEHIGISQPTIHRMLRTVLENPALLDETPTEVIDRRTAGQITDDDMMQVLLDWNFTFGQVPVSGGISTDAYEPGSWDEIERAYCRGLLTDDEIGRLMERNKDALEQAVRSA
ncbi:winged helix-turn-helix transcriptional regulator [Rhodococcus wratislaviensis]|nr:winged helix-turn-helix transcriptional regulator [Rhodococcus sp. 3A]MBC2897597.1 winged helix-turn-helix transcriptional regulator [Rhodococcus sp. 4CII]